MNDIAAGVGLILLVVFFEAVFVVGFNCGMGAIAAHMAKKRGLRPVPAFFLGFFMSFVALFIVAMVPLWRGAPASGGNELPPAA